MKTNYNRDFFIPEETNYQIYFFFLHFFYKTIKYWYKMSECVKIKSATHGGTYSR